MNNSTDIFFNQFDLNHDKVKSIVSESLHGMDDGELFLEYCISESISLDEGIIKSASFDTTQGWSQGNCW